MVCGQSLLLASLISFLMVPLLCSSFFLVFDRMSPWLVAPVTVRPSGWLRRPYMPVRLCRDLPDIEISWLGNYKWWWLLTLIWGPAPGDEVSGAPGFAPAPGLTCMPTVIGWGWSGPPLDFICARPAGRGRGALPVFGFSALDLLFFPLSDYSSSISRIWLVSLNRNPSPEVAIFSSPPAGIMKPPNAIC